LDKFELNTWLKKGSPVLASTAKVLFENDINGVVLSSLTELDLQQLTLTFGQRKLLWLLITGRWPPTKEDESNESTNVRPKSWSKPTNPPASSQVYPPRDGEYLRSHSGHPPVHPYYHPYVNPPPLLPFPRWGQDFPGSSAGSTTDFPTEQSKLNPGSKSEMPNGRDSWGRTKAKVNGRINPDGQLENNSSKSSLISLLTPESSPDFVPITTKIEPEEEERFSIGSQAQTTRNWMEKNSSGKESVREIRITNGNEKQDVGRMPALDNVNIVQAVDTKGNPANKTKDPVSSGVPVAEKGLPVEAVGCTAAKEKHQLSTNEETDQKSGTASSSGYSINLKVDVESSKKSLADINSPREDSSVLPSKESSLSKDSSNSSTPSTDLASLQTTMKKIKDVERRSTRKIELVEKLRPQLPRQEAFIDLISEPPVARAPDFSTQRQEEPGKIPSAQAANGVILSRSREMHKDETANPISNNVQISEARLVEEKAELNSQSQDDSVYSVPLAAEDVEPIESVPQDLPLPSTTAPPLETESSIKDDSPSDINKVEPTNEAACNEKDSSPSELPKKKYDVKMVGNEVTVIYKPKPIEDQTGEPQETEKFPNKQRKSESSKENSSSPPANLETESKSDEDLDEESPSKQEYNQNPPSTQPAHRPENIQVERHTTREFSSSTSVSRCEREDFEEEAEGRKEVSQPETDMNCLSENKVKPRISPVLSTLSDSIGLSPSKATSPIPGNNDLNCSPAGPLPETAPTVQITVDDSALKDGVGGGGDSDSDNMDLEVNSESASPPVISERGGKPRKNAPSLPTVEQLTVPVKRQVQVVVKPRVQKPAAPIRRRIRTVELESSEQPRRNQDDVKQQPTSPRWPIAVKNMDSMDIGIVAGPVQEKPMKDHKLKEKEKVTNINSAKAGSSKAKAQGTQSSAKYTTVKLGILPERKSPTTGVSFSFITKPKGKPPNATEIFKRPLENQSQQRISGKEKKKKNHIKKSTTLQIFRTFGGSSGKATTNNNIASREQARTTKNHAFIDGNPGPQRTKYNPIFGEAPAIGFLNRVKQDAVDDSVSSEEVISCSNKQLGRKRLREDAATDNVTAKSPPVKKKRVNSLGRIPKKNKEPSSLWTEMSKKHRTSKGPSPRSIRGFQRNRDRRRRNRSPLDSKRERRRDRSPDERDRKRRQNRLRDRKKRRRGQWDDERGSRSSGSGRRRSGSPKQTVPITLV